MGAGGGGRRLMLIQRGGGGSWVQGRGRGGCPPGRFARRSWESPWYLLANKNLPLEFRGPPRNSRGGNKRLEIFCSFLWVSSSFEGYVVGQRFVLRTRTVDHEAMCIRRCSWFDRRSAIVGTGRYVLFASGVEKIRVELLCRDEIMLRGAAASQRFE